MISPFSYSLGSGCCYGVHSVSQSISAGELESGSGISDQKSEGGVLGGKVGGGGNTSPACPGGATEKRLHLWCGRVKHECMCV